MSFTFCSFVSFLFVGFNLQRYANFALIVQIVREFTQKLPHGIIVD